MKGQMKKQIVASLLLVCMALTLTACAGFTQAVKTVRTGVNGVLDTSVSVAEGAEKAVNTGLAAVKTTAAVPTATTVNP